MCCDVAARTIRPAYLTLFFRWMAFFDGTRMLANGTSCAERSGRRHRVVDRIAAPSPPPRCARDFSGRRRLSRRRRPGDNRSRKTSPGLQSPRTAIMFAAVSHLSAIGTWSGRRLCRAAAGPVAVRFVAGVASSCRSCSGRSIDTFENHRDLLTTGLYAGACLCGVLTRERPATPRFPAPANRIE